MIKDIKLKEIMIKNIVKISQDEKITTAGKIMAMKNIGSILVTDNDDPVGILTEKDFIKKVISKGLDPNNVFVREVMTSNIVTASIDDSIFTGYKIIKEGKFRRLPIIDNNKIVGIVTETDLSDALNNFATMITPTTENIKNAKGKIQLPGKEYNLKINQSYVVIEEKPHKIFDVFFSLLKKNYAGLIISRINPKEIREDYGLKETLIIWLTNLNAPEAIKPTELQKLIFTITSFINNAEKSVVLFDGIEYLSNYTSFKEVLHLIQSLVDKTCMSNNTLLTSIDPETFDKKEFKLLERNMDIINS